MKISKSLALMLALVCFVSACAEPSGSNGSTENNLSSADSQADAAHGKSAGTEATQLAAVTYPESVPYPDKVEYDNNHNLNYDAYNKARREWENTWTERRRGSESNLEDLADYYRTATPVFLRAGLKTQKNAVCSPLNIYMALAMLAETTAGDTRAQILDLLGTDNTSTLEKTVANLWRTNYEEDSIVTCILGNSVWLSADIEYKQALLERLASAYYAESFSGVMGTPEYNQMLQSWLNDKTGGLLKEAADGIEMDPQTILALASTLYYKAGWVDEFDKYATDQGIFHGVDGDETVDMMHRTGDYDYYDGDGFRAAAFPLKESGAMWIVLPEEGEEAATLLENTAMWDLLSRRADDKIANVSLEVTLPRFDVDAQMSLIDGLRELGVTDVMDGTISDFSPLCDNADGIELSEATHAARVTADEEGVVGAAFTVLVMKATAAFEADPPIPFIVDRPFLFCVTAWDGSLLFVGMVNTVAP